MKQLFTQYRSAFVVGAILLVAGVTATTALLRQKSALEIIISNNEKDIADLQTQLSDKEKHLTSTINERNVLVSMLNEEQRKSLQYRDQLGEVTTEAERLKKLSETDRELLRKYSRVFFLSENYLPAALTFIDTKYLNIKTRPQQIHDKVWPFLRNLLMAAESNGQHIEIVSAYRSFDTQESLKSQYKVIYGAGTANQFSADQGYSEHQLGTAIDFTTPEVGSGLNGFEYSHEYAWLKNNAHRFGFILSYPPNNSYYQFEPWHWRFVGVKLATYLFNENKNFYDLDQREIDKYLLEIFDGVQN